MRLGFLALSVFLALHVLPRTAEAGPIYVYTQKDGTVKFTSVPPKSGVTAKVFTARKGSYSLYRIAPHYGGPSMVKLYGNEFNHLIKAASQITGLEAPLIKAVIHAESGFNPKAVSPKGARGLMQLMPGTARDLGVRDSFSPFENIHGGARYLAMLLKRFRGNVQFALAAYNAGMDNVDRYGGVPPFSETQNYVKNVLRLRERYSSSNG